jgi:hypothetical protein
MKYSDYQVICGTPGYAGGFSGIREILSGPCTNRADGKPGLLDIEPPTQSCYQLGDQQSDK